MRSAVKIAGIYVAIALAWIVLSDSVLSFLVQDIESLSWYSMVKGSFYVLATGGILYALIRKEMLQKSRMIVQLEQTVALRNSLIKELHHRVKNNLQNMISIIQMETDREGYTEEANRRILNKLYSISSVHDIVYNFEDFKRISLRSVLDGFFSYLRMDLGPEDLDVEEGVAYSIEEMVSLILCLNELLEELRTTGDVRRCSLRCRTREALEFEVELSESGSCSYDLEKVGLFLQGTGAALSCEQEDAGSGRLVFCIRFS